MRALFFVALGLFAVTAFAQPQPACKRNCDQAQADAKMICSRDLAHKEGTTPQAQKLVQEAIEEEMSAEGQARTSANLGSMPSRHSGYGQATGRLSDSYKKIAQLCREADQRARKVCVGPCSCTECSRNPGMAQMWDERSIQAGSESQSSRSITGSSSGR